MVSTDWNVDVTLTCTTLHYKRLRALLHSNGNKLVQTMEAPTLQSLHFHKGAILMNKNYL